MDKQLKSYQHFFVEIKEANINNNMLSSITY